MQIRITSIRRAVQVFFLALAVWFSVAPAIRETSGTHGGWPIRWMLELDPLVALTTSLASGSLVTGLAWSLLLVVTTVFLGRYFCGWICPLGTLQQFIGWISWRKMPLPARIKVNTYSEKQKAKWGILLLHLAAASGGTLVALVAATASRWWLPVVIFGAVAAFIARFHAQGRFKQPTEAWLQFAGVLLVYAWLAWSPRAHLLLSSSIQGEVLDPIPLFYRLLDLLLLPLADAAAGVMSPTPRTYAYGGLTALLGVAVLGSSVLVPRAFCRFACPLGAMLGTMSTKSVYRIASSAPSCIDCGLCDAVCEGACNPSGKIRSSECLLCMNCVEICPDNLLALRTVPNAPGEIVGSGLSRRGAMMSAIAGFAFVPALRLGGKTRTGWTEGLIRPPGALPEEEFLSRCISCERCVHVCPTNVIQPAGLKAGFEAMWTPALDMRVGTSGCLPNCTACGQACPTGALKPLTLDEKSGKGDFAAQGPLSLGTAFVDHGRCLPWSMDKFCIVCQEVCPTSPKAITTRPRYATLRDGRVEVESLDGERVRIAGPLPEGVVQGVYLRPADQDDASAQRVIRIEGGDVVLEGALHPEDLKRSGGQVELQARLEVPFVDPNLCIGCGICEHECPIDGERAIRVTAEGESREPSHSIVL